MNVNINRQKLGLEDIAFGTGTQTQVRGGVTGIITEINAANLPFDETKSLQDVYNLLLPAKEDLAIVVDNLAEILNSENNSIIATDKAAEALTSAAEALASAQEALAVKDAVIAGLIDNTVAGLDNTYSGSKIQNLHDTQAASIALIEDVLLDTKDDQSASEVPVTPSGAISATNVQAAIQELDDEKEPKNSNIQTHISSTLNPHSVTKTQVGLSNVDNTSDSNKPVSTATSTALSGKVDKTSVVTTAITSVTFNADGTITIVTP